MERLEAGGGWLGWELFQQQGALIWQKMLTVWSWRTVPQGPLPDGWDESIPLVVLAPAGAMKGAGTGAEQAKDVFHWFSWEGFRTEENITNSILVAIRQAEIRE